MGGSAFPFLGQLAVPEWPSSTGDSLALRDSPDARGGDPSSFQLSWLPARTPAWLTRLAPVLAVAAFLFIVSRCPLPSVPAAGPRLTGRRLASGEEGDDRPQNTSPSDWRACSELLDSSGGEEEGMPVDQSHTSEAVPEEGTVTRGSPPEKGESKPDLELSRPLKTARFAEGEEAPGGTLAALDPHSPSPPLGKGSSQSSSEASEGTSDISEDLLNFYFDEAMKAARRGEAAFASWLLDPAEEPPLSPTGGAEVENEEDKEQPIHGHSPSAPPEEDVSTNFLEASEGTSDLSEGMLDFLLEEAVKAVGHGEQAFESSLLEPSEGVPSSPTGEAAVEREQDKKQAASPIEGVSGGLRAGSLQPPRRLMLHIGIAEHIVTCAQPDKLGHATNRKLAVSKAGTIATLSAEAKKGEQDALLCLLKIPETGTDTSGTLAKRQREAVAYEAHPFYRTPDVPDTVAQAALQMVPVFTILPTMDLVEDLNTARAILAKPVVTASDVHELLSCGQKIIHYATAHMSRPLAGTKSSQFLPRLSMRFLVADTLYCVCEVVGPAMNKSYWWDKLMSTMLASPPQWAPKYLGSGLVASRRQLAERLISAFDHYRAGQRPAAREVVQMKQEILCGEYMFSVFKDFSWDPWREADKEFQESS
ncbi:hypothetical protein Efla_000731 [Eimeria flavescens]